ncbi:hypothetical protein G6553_13015 [Nocardioides sp. IC4_145]|uniref:hypothetical protein n=1 Tax=Nocardioides sp. IC4_145 TaxID=2714037 RepID=UPI00140D283F|nr:hypothetical protein [Nocardioides sp. IC4_145]NHC24090.1 hypothetical protein [Nocardioides sp. IC4_145]
MSERPGTAKRGDDTSSNLAVRATRSTVGRESTTFGFSILVTALFGMQQVVHGTPGAREVIAYAVGAVMSFTVLEAVLSKGFRHPMPQHHTRVLALGTALNVASVLGGLLAGWGCAELLDGWVSFAVTPFVAGVVYLLIESLEAAASERLLARSGVDDAEEVSD